MHRCCAVLFDIRHRLFLDRGNHDLNALRFCGVKHEKGELTVSCYEAELLWLRRTHQVNVASTSYQFASYLITPRCDDSINLTSNSTSSPSADSVFSFSIACDVFSFDANSTLKAWCSLEMRSFEKPRRCRPTLLSMKACVSRSALVIE